MIRLAITLAFLASCGASAKPAASTAGAGQPAAIVAKRVALSWGIEKQGEMADIFLATTDETGKQVSHPLGRYKGECAVMVPAREMNALTGVLCRTGATGTELHAIIEHGEDIVVLQLNFNEGVTGDPMARKELTRVKVPLGAKIELGS